MLPSQLKESQSTGPHPATLCRNFVITSPEKFIVEPLSIFDFNFINGVYRNELI